MTPGTNIWKKVRDACTACCGLLTPGRKVTDPSYQGVMEPTLADGTHVWRRVIALTTDQDLP
jgi:hypothetical protein